MKTFLKVLVVALLVLVAIKLLPLTLLAAVMLGGVALFVLVVGLSAAAALFFVAVGLAALLSPIWLPVLAIVGLVSLLRNNKRNGATTA